jgi:hypothetical protein
LFCNTATLASFNQTNFISHFHSFPNKSNKLASRTSIFALSFFILCKLSRHIIHLSYFQIHKICFNAVGVTCCAASLHALSGS